MKILHRRTLAGAEDPDALRADLESQYRAEVCTPWPAAEGGFIDQVIEVADTRRVFIESLC